MGLFTGMVYLVFLRGNSSFVHSELLRSNFYEKTDLLRKYLDVPKSRPAFSRIPLTQLQKVNQKASLLEEKR